MKAEPTLFEKESFAGKRLPREEYIDCTFRRCDFTGADMRGCSFVECRFEHCDLSTARWTNATLRDVRFSDSKLLGAAFCDCNPFLWSADFEACRMDFALLSGMRLKKQRFVRCRLQHADFSGADLEGALFDECDLSGAVFENCMLEKADFSTALGYSFDLSANRIRKARFSQLGIRELLERYGIVVEP